MNFTTQEKTLLCKILSYDCTYLEESQKRNFKFIKHLEEKLMNCDNKSIVHFFPIYSSYRLLY